MSQSLPLTERSFSHRTLFNTNEKFQSNVAFALNSKPGLITKQSLWWYLWSFRKRHPCPRGEQNSQNLNLVTTRSTVGRKVIWKGLTRHSLSLMNHLLGAFSHKFIQISVKIYSFVWWKIFYIWVYLLQTWSGTASKCRCLGTWKVVTRNL